MGREILSCEEMGFFIIIILKKKVLVDILIKKW